MFDLGKIGRTGVMFLIIGGIVYVSSRLLNRFTGQSTHILGG